MGWKWYTATCADCEPRLVMPFRKPEDREVWVKAHEQATRQAGEQHVVVKGAHH